MKLLKQSTAFTYRIGPFVDSTDGITPETGLSIGQSDMQISKAGGAFAQTSDTTPTTTHDTGGFYQCPLTTTDTATLGALKISIQMSGAVPVWDEWMVVPANVFDAFVNGSDVLDVSVTELGGVAQSLTDLKDFADAGYDPATNKVEGVKLADTTTTNTDLVTAAAVRTEMDSNSTQLAAIVADTNELQTDDVPGLIATAQADLDIITGASGVNLLTATQASIDAIEADTNELQTDDVPGLIATAQADLDIITGASGVNLLTATQASIDAIEADTAEIGTAGAGLTAIPEQNVNVAKISGNSDAADRLEESAKQILVSSVNDASASTTQFVIGNVNGASPSSVDDFYNDHALIFTSGALAGQVVDVADYTGSTTTITISAATSAPADSVTFVMI